MDQERVLQTGKVLQSACILILDKYSETFTVEDITNAQLFANAGDIELIEWVQDLVDEMGEGDWVARACFIILAFHRDLRVARSCGVSFPDYLWFHGLVVEPGGFSELAAGILASFMRESVGLAIFVRNYMSFFGRDEWLRTPEFANLLIRLEAQTRSTDPLYYSTLLSLTPSHLNNWQKGALAARAAASSGRVFNNDRFGLMAVRSRAAHLTTTLVYDIEPTREELESLIPILHVSKAAIWQESPYGRVKMGQLVAGKTGNFRRLHSRASVSGRNFRIKSRPLNIPRWNGPTTVDVVSDYGRTFAPASMEEDTMVIRGMMRRMRSGVSSRWECWAEWMSYVQAKYPALYDIAKVGPHATKLLGMISACFDARGISNIWFNRLFEHFGERGILVLAAERQICIQINGYTTVPKPSVQLIFWQHPPGVYDDVVGAFIETRFGLSTLQGVIHLSQKQRDRNPGLHQNNLADAPVFRQISLTHEDENYHNRDHHTR